MYPRLGTVEVIISCLFGLIGIGLPFSMLVFLYMIYNKVKSIDFWEFPWWIPGFGGASVRRRDTLAPPNPDLFTPNPEEPKV